jgi:hypothetical protein
MQIESVVKEKLKEWARRYLPAELFSLIVTMFTATVTFHMTGSGMTTALVSTWIGTGVYFGYILLMDVREARRQRHANGHAYTFATFAANIRALLVEFGLAELVDLLVIRPALMYYLPIWFGSLALGTLVAKVAADLTFYTPAIVGYELSKRWFRDFR